MYLTYKLEVKGKAITRSLFKTRPASNIYACIIKSTIGWSTMPDILGRYFKLWSYRFHE